MNSSPKFPFIADWIYKKLQTAVAEYFKNSKKKTNWWWKLYRKAIAIIFLLVITYTSLMLAPTLWRLVLAIYMVLGFIYALIGFNIIHDANHWSFYKNNKANKRLWYSFDFIWGDKYEWIAIHNEAHHTYTNIEGHDHDIDYFGVMRMAPKQELKRYHKYQHIYCFGVYAFASLFWLWLGWLKLGPSKLSHDQNIKKWKKDTTAKIVYWTIKVVYLSMLIIIPAIVHNWRLALIWFVAFHTIMWITIFTVFQLAHVVDSTTFPEVQEVPKWEMKNERALHQIQTTVNFANWNKLITRLLWGLNYQIEHHLFPRISHIHYPEISKIVRKICKEENIQYNHYKSFWSALAAHTRHLYNMGRNIHAA